MKGRGVTDVWIGLLKTLMWSDGSPFVHEPWQDIRTNDGKSCFGLREDRGYRWDDLYCHRMDKFVCEYEGMDFAKHAKVTCVGSM